MKYKIFNIIIFVVLLVLAIHYVEYYNKEKEYKPPEIRIDTLEYKQHFHSKLPQDGLMEALIYYDIKYPHIVYAQALIETGNFKSSLCRKHHNLFGIKRGRSYAHYATWQQSVADYKKRISSRYKGGDYYAFLRKIGYAEDGKYISKLKRF